MPALIQSAIRALPLAYTPRVPSAAGPWQLLDGDDRPRRISRQPGERAVVGFRDGVVGGRMRPAHGHAREPGASRVAIA